MLRSVHLPERLELVFLRGGAELGNVGRPRRLMLGPKRIQVSDPRDRGAEEIGPLGNGSPYQDSAGAGPGAGQMLRRGVALLHEILPAGNEILPGVRLGRLLPGLMPVLTVLASTSHVRRGEHSTPLQPGEARGAEPWIVS